MSKEIMRFGSGFLDFKKYPMKKNHLSPRFSIKIGINGEIFRFDVSKCSYGVVFFTIFKSYRLNHILRFHTMLLHETWNWNHFTWDWLHFYIGQMDRSVAHQKEKNFFTSLQLIGMWVKVTNPNSRAADSSFPYRFFTVLDWVWNVIISAFECPHSGESELWPFNIYPLSII